MACSSLERGLVLGEHSICVILDSTSDSVTPSTLCANDCAGVGMSGHEHG
jgi:hypothetical protein